MLSKSAQTDDIQRFTELASAFTEPGDKEKADAVLQVSVAANRKNYDKVRRTSDMCEACLLYTSVHRWLSELHALPFAFESDSTELITITELES